MKFDEQNVASVQVTEAELFLPPVTVEERKGIDPDLNALLAALEHERIAALAFSLWQERAARKGRRTRIGSGPSGRSGKKHSSLAMISLSVAPVSMRH